MIVLAGDIGGTKTWLQIARFDGGARCCEVCFEERYESQRYPRFETLLAEFIASAGELAKQIDAACIGVAGPVEVLSEGQQRAQVTNLPWHLDTQQLVRDFAIPHFHLLNDFQAAGYGIETLTAADVLVLQAGQPQARAPRVLIGAGTGLGQGVLVWSGDAQSGHYQVLPSEGGHGDFAPGDAQQRELLQFLAQQQPRVSVEDVLSGRGLVNVYRFLASSHPDEASDSLRQAMSRGDAAAAVSEAALTQGDVLANRALDLFLRIYGSQAGNLALTCLATGGVYIAGGIAPRLQQRMSQGDFLAAFRHKDPMGTLMERIPVTLVLDTQLGLKGAALVASRLSA
jgi:glucokinase